MTNAESESKKVRREAAREHAREQREIAAKKRKRNKLFAQGGVLLGALAIAAVIVLVLTNINKPPSPGPLNMLSDGIVLTGDGTDMGFVETKAIKAGGEPVASTPSDDPEVVSIVMYVDYQCPFCQQFEATNGAQLGDWVTSGMATLEIHPAAVLDSQSLGARYSSRATNAAACVANFEPEKFFDVNTALFENQPAEGTTGLTTAQLKTVVADAGASSSDVADCIGAETFKTWVTEATQRTREPLPNSTLEGLAATPTVLVNGQQYQGGISDPAEFLAFVTGVAQTAAGVTPEG
jgi:protein-disulfide isomerase